MLSAFQLRFLLAALTAPTIMPARQGLAVMQGLAAGALSEDDAQLELAARLVPTRASPAVVRPTAAIASLMDAAADARGAALGTDAGLATATSGVLLKEGGSGEFGGDKVRPRAGGAKAELRKTMKSGKGARWESTRPLGPRGRERGDLCQMRGATKCAKVSM